jgi:hypothetical protein
MNRVASTSGATPTVGHRLQLLYAAQLAAVGVWYAVVSVKAHEKTHKRH